jgi:hypothetical protein
MSAFARTPSSASGRDGVRRAESTARRAGESHWIDKLARLGFAARGLTYLLVGYFALQIAFGGSSHQASRGGAFHAIAEKSWGKPLLWVMAIGFFGMAAWRLTEAIWGHDDEDSGAKKAAKRVYSAGRAVLYAFIGYSAASLAAGSSSGSSGGSGSSAHSVSADLMKKSYGRPLIVVIGIVLIGIGIGLAWRGATTKFEKKLKTEQMGRLTESVARKVGAVGMIARGVVIGLIGVFLIESAVTFDPGKARGLDGSLRELADNGWGKALLVAVALGLIAFGLYSFIEARYRRTGNEDGSSGTGSGTRDSVSGGATGAGHSVRDTLTRRGAARLRT